MTRARHGAKYGGGRILTRVLAVMLAGVLAVQLANFALLQFVPLPQAPFFTVAHVAAVLRQGRDTQDDFNFSVRTRAARTTEGRAPALAVALARELRMPPERVSLSIVDPPMMGRGPRRREAWAFGPSTRDAMIVGDFTAALQRPDGRWLAAQPKGSGMNAWRVRLIFWLLAALATVTPFAWLLARWVTRPIGLFAGAAERIGRNPHTEPLAETGPAEIAHAARAMNEMQSRLNRYVDDRMVMIGAIAHDLRTPLMRMALRLERAPDELRRGVERDVADMQSMIAAAADYVRGATRIGSRRRLDLRSLAESAVDAFVDRGDPVEIMPGERVVIDGDPVTIRSVIDNLLTNAIRYAGDAVVSVSQDEHAAIIEVRDHGPGMPDEDIARAFDPFFRGEQSRSREMGGLGLGLASVRGVVNLHGGDVTLRNHPEGGLLARITLPLGGAMAGSR